MVRSKMSDAKKTPLHSAEENHLMERKTSGKLFSRPGYFMKTVMRRLENTTKTMGKQIQDPNPDSSQASYYDFWKVPWLLSWS